MYMHFLISPCAQVKAEFLSADGKVISKSSQPCMLKFKSVHMHFVETFLQSASLLSGYHWESLEPTTGVRIILKQRAEFGPGAGIPEFYAASLKLGWTSSFQENTLELEMVPY
jgi:seipin